MSSEETEEERWFAEHLLPHEAMLRGWLASRYPTGVDIDDVIQRRILGIEVQEEEPINVTFLRLPKPPKYGPIRG